MRLNQYQITESRRAVRELVGAQAGVRLFGSRLDDKALNMGHRHVSTLTNVARRILADIDRRGR